ncbi:hypothetical protein BDY24DRAFT_418262 [Mrakia frigida]|uniref:uncharacterized protein n=1 Tax=Mrakia frigida TaxID=29902 RepID=UPI003FCC1E27
MSSFIFKPRPSLPLELQHEILRQCDPSTLAQTSRVSLAFLDLSSPLLYRDIAIVGLEGLQRLLVPRNEPAQPHLSPYLDLTSISSFTFHFVPGDDSVHPSLSLTRLSSRSSQILVDKLVLLFPFAPLSFLEHFWDLLLPLFNPKLVEVSGECSPRPSSYFLSRIDLTSTSSWTNLQEIAAASLNYLGYSGFLLSRSNKEDRKVTIAWDLGRKRDGSRIGTNVYEALRTNAENELDGEEELLGTRRLKELVIRVLDKQEEKYILVFVKAGWVCDGIEEKVRDEWRSRLRFEVVETRCFNINTVLGLSLFARPISSPSTHPYLDLAPRDIQSFPASFPVDPCN